MTLTIIFASLPSPFPDQFMVGIDEQQLDLERGYPTYVMGRWFPDGIGWYYLAAYVIKEHVVVCLAIVLSAVSFPHYFAKMNPLCGGTYRVPPALHDTNFDGGQDVDDALAWIARQTESGVTVYAALRSVVPAECLGNLNVPSDAILNQLAMSKRNDERLSLITNEVPEQGSTWVVVSRGLMVPAPWTLIVGRDGALSVPGEALRSLADVQPAIWITPTIVAFRLD